MSTETIICDCGCGGICTVDARSEAVAYAHGSDPTARAFRHQLVTAARHQGDSR
ncbi:hypothetical protein ACSDR0_11605 [Streptosporangium sp. G11]|uniref:hypothetical protein n=1 Tax=Streptosporangium sp. G11 TaxID=3436926 RepID=UPI003EB98B49